MRDLPGLREFPELYQVCMSKPLPLVPHTLMAVSQGKTTKDEQDSEPNLCSLTTSKPPEVRGQFSELGQQLWVNNVLWMLKITIKTSKIFRSPWQMCHKHQKNEQELAIPWRDKTSCPDYNIHLQIVWFAQLKKPLALQSH